MPNVCPRHGLQLLGRAACAAAALVWPFAAGGCNLGKPKAEQASGAAVSSASKPAAEAPKPLTPQEQMVEDYSALGYRLDWVSYAPVLSKGRVKIAQPLGDVVAVLDTMGALTLLNVRDGTQRWSHMAGDGASVFLDVVRVGDSIVACEQGQLRIFDVNSGTMTDKQGMQRVVSTGAAQLGDVLVFGSSGGRVIAHSVNGGYGAWTSMIDGPVQAPPVAIGGDTVGVVSSTGQVLMLDAMSGAMRGHARLFGGSSVSPVSDDDTLYIASLDQSFYALARLGGRTLWRIRTEQPLQAQPNLYKGSLLVQMPDGFQSLEAATGKVRWTNKSVTGAVAAVRRNRAIVWNGEVASVVDLTSGQTVSAVKMPTTAMILSESGADGPIYLVTASGQVSRLVPK